MVNGTPIAYVGATNHIPIPRATDTTHRTAHKPWCADCKRTVEPLDADQRCERCARAAVTRAAAAARRAEAEAAAAAAPKLPEEEKQGKPATRTSAPRATSTSSTTRTARDAGPSTHREKNPPATQETRPAVAGGPTPDQELHAQLEHATRVLTRSWQHNHPAVDALRTSASAALEALHLFLELTPTTATNVHHGAANRRGGRRDKIRLPGREIAQAYRDGASIRDLADQHAVSAPTIVRHLDEQGVVRRKQKVDYTPELIEAVRARYVDLRMTQEAVAADLAVTTKVVQTAMAKGGIEPRESAAARSARGIGHSIKIPAEDHPEIIRRYQAGESAPAIAKTYDATATSIYPILTKHGITDRHCNRTLAGPAVDNASPIKKRLAELGVTSREVKTWAVRTGLLANVARGIPPRAVVDAYAAAHTTTEGAATA